MLLLEALHAHPTPRPPVWLMRQAGRYLPEYQTIRKQAPNFLDRCYTPDVATEITLQPVRRYDLDAAILFSDILVIPHALGMDVQFIEGKGPVLPTLGQDTDIETDITHLQARTATVMDTLAPVAETVRQTRAALPDAKALIGFCGAPWTVAAYMLDAHPSKDALRTRQLAYQHPDLFAKLMDSLVEASATYLCAQIAAGANAVQIFDSWAGLVPPALHQQALLDPVKQLTLAVKSQYPDVPVIYFPRQAPATIYEACCHLPITALGTSHTDDASWLHNHIQPHKPVQGNLDPALLLTDPSTIRQATQQMLKTFTPRPGYIANLGHGVNQHTPPENVAAFVETIQNFQSPHA